MMSAAKLPANREIQIALSVTALMLLLAVISRAVSSEARSYDFVALYTGGTILRQGHVGQLYDLNEQRRVELELFDRTNLMVYNHPPFVALLFAPLTRLTYTGAYVVWGMINIALWISFVCLMRPWAPVPKHTLRYFLLCFGFFPAWDALLQGQTSLLLVGLYAWAFVSLKRRRDFQAGLALGLGLFKFPVVLPFASICLLRGKWRMMAGFALGALLLGALSLIAVGPAGVVSYANLLLDIARNPADPAYGAIRPWNMPTVRGFFSALGAGVPALPWVNAAATLASVLLMLFTAWRWRREDRRENAAPLDLIFAAALTVTQVTSPHLNAHDLVLMLLAVLLVIGSPQWSGKSSLVLTGCVVILYFLPVYPALAKWGLLYLLAPVLVTFALAALSLAGRVTPSRASVAA